MADPLEWVMKGMLVSTYKTLIFKLFEGHLFPNLQNAVLVVHYPLAFLIGPQINGSLKQDKFNNVADTDESITILSTAYKHEK